MKRHSGAGSQSGLAHSAVVTPANVHVFAVVKRLWGFVKVRYRSLDKNVCRAITALALANIYLARHRLMAQVRP